MRHFLYGILICLIAISSGMAYQYASDRRVIECPDVLQGEKLVSVHSEAHSIFCVYTEEPYANKRLAKKKGKVK